MVVSHQKRNKKVLAFHKPIETSFISKVILDGRIVKIK